MEAEVAGVGQQGWDRHPAESDAKKKHKNYFIHFLFFNSILYFRHIFSTKKKSTQAQYTNGVMTVA